MLIFIDELVNIYKIPHAITRQYNYEKILSDIEQMCSSILPG